jgi:fructokinase
LSAFEIADFAARGDAECGATLDRYMDRLARGLALVINLIDPDVIVLGAAIPAYRRCTSECPFYGGGTPSLIM